MSASGADLAADVTDFFDGVFEAVQTRPGSVNVEKGARLQELLGTVENTCRIWSRAMRTHRGWSMGAEGEDVTMNDVECVCKEIVEALGLVPVGNAECATCVAALRAVLRTAQERFGIVDKNISVQVVEADATDATAWTRHAAKQYTINEDQSVQQAVQKAYPAFPGACAEIYRVRDRLGLWSRAWRGDEWPGQGMYGFVQGGDVLEIVLRTDCPGAPCPWIDRLNWPAPGAFEVEDAGAPVAPGQGPAAVQARLRSLLARLKESGV
jgi:hypothetical protein